VSRIIVEHKPLKRKRTKEKPKWKKEQTHGIKIGAQTTTTKALKKHAP
jgi:hypothetical protein